MLEFKSYILLESDHKFSCVMANFDTQETVKWTKKHIKKEDIFEEEGIEDEPHVTILYGLHTDNIEEVKSLFKTIKPFTVTFGEITKFQTNPKFDVLKIDIKSSELFKLNKICKTLEYTSTYKDYRPHCTLAYVKKGKCNEFVGDKKFEGKKFLIKEIVFSSKDRKHSKFSLDH
jgi:2'-5' RNA ligase